MNSGVSSDDNFGNNTDRRSLVVIVLLAILLIVSVVFGIKEYSSARNYKNNSDKIVNQALALKAQQLQAQAQTAFDAVNTYQYQGSATYGSITFRYPKMWSAYVDTTSAQEPINGYFYPNQVPGLQSKTAFALRVELVSTDYAQVLQQFSSQITQGTVTAKAYVPPKMQGVANVSAGTYLNGQINSQDQTQNGEMVIIKVRDKTLQIYTESNQFADDFNNITLAGLKFTP